METGKDGFDILPKHLFSECIGMQDIDVVNGIEGESASMLPVSPCFFGSPNPDAAQYIDSLSEMQDKAEW